MSKERYKQNRARVCEIYGLDPNEVSCHHIVQRSDVKGRNPKFKDFDVDQPSNLYPFEADLGNGISSEHNRTHRLIEATETKVIYSSKRNKGRRKNKRK